MVVDVDKGDRNLLQILGKQLYTNVHPGFLLHFQKQLERSVMMLVSTQETKDN
jgi:hypothetical protein